MPSRCLSWAPCSRLKCHCSQSIRRVCRQSALSAHRGLSVVLASAVAVALTMASRPVHVLAAAAPQLFDPAAAASVAAFISEASRRYRIPAAWIRAVMHVESAGDTHALSPKGAMGLMQIMPQTWADLGKRYHLGVDPYDPRANIMAGTAYLRELLDRYGTAGFLAAYNAGPARWVDYISSGRPLPTQTYAYLAQLAFIVDNRGSHSQIPLISIAHSWSVAQLFPWKRSGALSAGMTTWRSRVRGRSNVHSVTHWAMLAPTAQGLFVALSMRGHSQ